MFITQKSEYALRAIFELAKTFGQGPIRISEIAKSQVIPAGFLQVILNQLKQGGFVDSRRGTGGGYFLTRAPHGLSVAEVLDFIQGPVAPVTCVTDSAKKNCPLFDGCLVLPMWEKVHRAISGVFGETTFEDLIVLQKKKSENYVPEYYI